MHDSNAFSTPRRNGENIIFNQDHTNSQQKPHNTTRINFCEPEREIGFARLFEQINMRWNTRSTWGW